MRKKNELMSVKIGPELYRAYTVPSFKNGNMGRCYYSKSEIVISEAYEERKQRNTLWHEIIHAISDTYQIGLTEEQVRMMEVGIVGLIDDNPHLIEFTTRHQ